jgi:FtsP/CotA-like multicopper oxidase with cupredoxin domain
MFGFIVYFQHVALPPHAMRQAFARVGALANRFYTGKNLYEFDPTRGTYVWHCHVIDHEDNEMMRPYRVTW